MKKVASIALLLVMMVGIASLTAPTADAKKPPVGGGGCLCPDVYDPVYCTSNGQSYSNFCQAGCAGASGCTRTGDI